MADMGWTSYRTGPGSGNHYSDGMQYGDWNPYGGSETYRMGLAMGFQDIGGVLYTGSPDGGRIMLGLENGRPTFEKVKNPHVEIGVIERDGETKQQPWDKNGDGKLSLEEANEYYRTGGGTDIYVKASSVDLRSVNPDIFYGEKPGKVKVVQLLYTNVASDGLVYGKLNLVYLGGKKVMILPNEYDFDVGAKNDRPWFNSGSGFARNVFTVIGYLYATHFWTEKSYMVNFTGTTNLNRAPQKPSINQSKYYPYH